MFESQSDLLIRKMCSNNCYCTDLVNLIALKELLSIQEKKKKKKFHKINNK